MLLSYRGLNIKGILKGFYKGSIVGFYRAHYTIFLIRNPKILLMDKILHDLKDSKLWDGIFLIMGNAGFCPSTVV